MIMMKVTNHPLITQQQEEILEKKMNSVTKKIQMIKNNKKITRKQIFLRHFDETDTKFLNLRVMLTLIAVMKKN